MKYVFMCVATFICWFWGLGFCEDAAPVVTSVTADGAATWIGYAWAIATAVCGLATGAAALLRAIWPESKAATVIDAVGHWSGVVGTTLRPQAIMPKKDSDPSTVPTEKMTK